MILYLYNIVQAFLPAALITGSVLALWGRTFVRRAISAVAVGLASGTVIFLVAFSQSADVEARAAIDVVSIATAVLGGTAMFFSPRRNIVLTGAVALFVSVLACDAMFSFLASIADHRISDTSVLNSGLILNIGGILAGIFIIGLVGAVAGHMGSVSGRAAVRTLVVAMASLLVLMWGAGALLGFMRMEMAEITSGRLTFVAKVTDLSHASAYVAIAMTCILSFIGFFRRPVLGFGAAEGTRSAECRKARSRVLIELRWLKVAVAALLMVVSPLLYYDLHASRPPEISTPVNLRADKNGLIRIKQDDVKDGKLHRYSYITGDGHVVRFFLINKYEGYVNIGVVYDACMICGSRGFVQKGKEVICLACNVRIFVPSIGKSGGCNPIPFKHEVKDGYVVISAEELSRGAKHFDEVVSIDVEDPVTGSKLTNLEAPYSYQYGGRTFYFDSEESRERFRESPETYAAHDPAGDAKNKGRED